MLACYFSAWSTTECVCVAISVCKTCCARAWCILSGLRLSVFDWGNSIGLISVSTSAFIPLMSDYLSGDSSWSDSFTVLFAPYLIKCSPFMSVLDCLDTIEIRDGWSCSWNLDSISSPGSDSGRSSFVTVIMGSSYYSFIIFFWFSRSFSRRSILRSLFGLFIPERD